MNYSIKLSVVLASLALGACGPAATSQDAGTDVLMSQDTAPADVAPADAQACVSTVPPAPYCAMSACAFAPVSLPLCDGSGNYDFYGADYCGVTATVMVISAGWCVPCMQEAPMIQHLITEAYADRHVRVITVYAQNPDGSTPDDVNCNHWRNAYHLTSTMTRDPMGATQRYVPGNAFPSNVVIDQHGNIYDVLYGSESGLTTLTSDLDAILATQGL